MDLTAQQDQIIQDEYTEIDDELDLLEAYIDPWDTKSL